MITPSPGAARVTSELPKLENRLRIRLLLVAATPITLLYAAGQTCIELPSFPADATQITPFDAA